MVFNIQLSTVWLKKKTVKIMQKGFIKHEEDGKILELEKNSLYVLNCP